MVSSYDLIFHIKFAIIFSPESKLTQESYTGMIELYVKLQSLDTMNHPNNNHKVILSFENIHVAV